MELCYGLHYDRDFLLDIIYKVKLVVPIMNLLTLYPACFYLLLVEGPAMKSAIRAAYLAYFVVHMLFDVVFNVLMRVYALPPYGIFYCEGILCTIGLSKPVTMSILTTAIIMCIPVYVFLMLRMHHMVVMESTSRWNFSWKSQFAYMFSLILMLIGNVIGFVIYTEDVPDYELLVKTPELSWLHARGGMMFLFGEPGKESRFVNEMILFGASFSFFLPPVIFFTRHAMYLLKRTSASTSSNKTHRLTKKLFDVFRIQLRSAMVFFVIPLILDIVPVVVDMRHFLPAPLFALARFGTVILFTINPAQFALIFILRNETHRTILRRKLRSVLIGTRLFDSCLEGITITKQITARESTSLRLR